MRQSRVGVLLSIVMNIRALTFHTLLNQAAIKFIDKERIPRQSYANDDRYGYIPFEAHFLRKMSHPNIIAFLDLFATDRFFLLVTELHGTEWRYDNPALSVARNPGLRVPRGGDYELVPMKAMDYTGMGIEEILDVKRTARDLFECIDAQYAKGERWCTFAYSSSLPSPQQPPTRRAHRQENLCPNH